MATETYISPNMVAQSIVSEFCSSGAIDGSIETVKNALRERRDALAAALERELPEARFTPPEGGYFMWVELPEGTDVDALAGAARERGLVFVKGTDFLIEGGENTLRIAYSGVRPDQIEEAIGRLAGDLPGPGAGRRRVSGGRRARPRPPARRRSAVRRRDWAIYGRNLWAFLLHGGRDCGAGAADRLRGSGFEQLTRALWTTPTFRSRDRHPRPPVTFLRHHAAAHGHDDPRARLPRPRRATAHGPPPRCKPGLDVVRPVADGDPARRRGHRPRVAGPDPARHLPARALVLRAPGGRGGGQASGRGAAGEAARSSGRVVADVRDRRAAVQHRDRHSPGLLILTPLAAAGRGRRTGRPLFARRQHRGGDAHDSLSWHWCRRCCFFDLRARRHRGDAALASPVLLGQHELLGERGALGRRRVRPTTETVSATLRVTDTRSPLAP